MSSKHEAPIEVKTTQISFADDDLIVTVEDASEEKPASFLVGTTKASFLVGTTKETVINKTKAPLQKTDFNILLELTEAGLSEDRPGHDLVAVLDISESMREDQRLEKLKRAMAFLIKKLSNIDRLSIVAFRNVAGMLPSASLPSAMAASMFVYSDGVENQASGTASGMAPYAHLSIYKACSESECATSDILAGMDRAILDGVDVMSLSLGSPSRLYYSDSIAIGAYSAMTKGIFVSCAGGNSGLGARTLSNEAPWMLTVGASTLDRNIRTTVSLGNGGQINGESMHRPKEKPSPMSQLVYPGASLASARDCMTLEGVNVKGKIVVCDDGNVNRVDKGIVVKNAEGAGVIITNVEVKGVTTSTDPHVLLVSHVSYSDGVNIKAYIEANISATASNCL